jgi:hypothetical protein
VSDWSLRKMERPYAFIQWKGTDVCMDFKCLCGGQFHLDAYFCYKVRCGGCGREYEMSCHIEARLITEEEKEKDPDRRDFVKEGERWDPTEPDQEE